MGSVVVYTCSINCSVCTECHAHKSFVSRSADNAKGESPANSAPRETTDNQTPPTPMTPGGGEFPERVSIGGESLGSYSEFETVSFADETGQQRHVHVYMCMYSNATQVICTCTSA